MINSSAQTEGPNYTTRFPKGNIPWNSGKKMMKPPHNKLPTKIVKCKCCGEEFEVAVNSPRKYASGHYQKIMETNNPSKDQQTKDKIRNSVIKMYVDFPEVKDKIRKSVKDVYQKHPKILEDRKPCGPNQTPGSYTSIEKKVSQSLAELNMQFLHNSKVGKYSPDFIILDNVIIECDGIYWHRNKGAYDTKREHYLMDRGYFVFRLTEERIHADTDKAVKSIIQLSRMLKEGAPEIIPRQEQKRESRPYTRTERRNYAKSRKPG